jgi:hypothetical protein
LTPIGVSGDISGYIIMVKDFGDGNLDLNIHLYMQEHCEKCTCMPSSSDIILVPFNEF